jgi:hypothetical protein
MWIARSMAAVPVTAAISLFTSAKPWVAPVLNYDLASLVAAAAAE